MLFTKDTWAGMADGSITLTFRAWRRPQAVAGRSYRSPVGMLAVSAVDMVEVASITEDEARRSGAPDRARLVARLGGEDAAPVYRIAFTFAGEDPRRALREDVPDDAAIADLRRRLARLDKASKVGPWTQATLAIIDRRPATVSTELAAELGRDRPSFKLDVRKLKALGLTESLDVGYRLSPRGLAVLAAIQSDRDTAENGTESPSSPGAASFGR